MTRHQAVIPIKSYHRLALTESLSVNRRLRVEVVHQGHTEVGTSPVGVKFEWDPM